MEAKTRDLERVFDPTIAYQIPLFQRPYVWDKEKNWEPLWDDIELLLDKQLSGQKTHPHFLGAVVFEQFKNPTGSIETRQVIDGQQRLTTLQLFLLAARDLCRELGVNKYLERFTDLTANKENRVDNKTDSFKVWPTNADREDFMSTHGAGSPSLLRNLFGANGNNAIGKRIPDAYLYFYSSLADWVSGDLSDDVSGVSSSQEDRLESLWQVARTKLQIVVIDLDDDDESQVIFETLNARGTKLLPADLVKNYLFRKAVESKDDVESLYIENWKEFDKDFWREEVRQGRIKRPRIDLFLQHYLSMKTLDDVSVAHLFDAYKTYAESECIQSGSLHIASKHLASLSDYGSNFAQFYNPPTGSRLAIFLKRLDAVDTATVYPFLLEAYHTLEDEYQSDLDEVLVMLESFLIRRMVCRLTVKNYNKLFIELLKASVSDGRVDKYKVATYLLRGDGDSNRFPSDDEFTTAWMQFSAYGWLSQKKVKMILEALDSALEHSKSETVLLPSKLNIEHILPQNWHAHWRLELEDTSDPLEKQKKMDARDAIKQTFGNLTLITESLNPALSNGSWEDKQPELLKFSKLNLNRYFHNVGQWNESAIEERGRVLLKTAKGIWPYPANEHE